MKNVLPTAAVLFALVASGAQAATVVYDESDSGDAGGSISGVTNIGTLSSDAISSILGGFDAGNVAGFFGDGPDEQDSYSFTTLDSFTIDATTLSGDPATYILYDGSGSDFLGVGLPGTDIFGTFSAGTYIVALIGQSNQGTGSYQIDINVGAVPIPLPASVPLLLAGLGALGLTARKRART